LDYAKVFDGAVKERSELLSEMQKLYKKHSLEMKLTSGSAAIKKKDSGVLRNQIIEESRLRLDLFNEGNKFSSNSKFIRIVKKGSASPRKDGKCTSFEEKFSKFVGLNSDEVIVLKIPDRTEAKLNFLFLGEDAALTVPLFIEVGNHSKLDLFEWFGSASSSRILVAPFHIVNTGKNSSVEVSILHNENIKTSVASVNSAKVMEGSALKLNFIYNGGGTVKSTTFADALGTGSGIQVNEIVLGNAEQRYDLNTCLFNSGKSTSAVLNSGAVVKDNSLCILKGYAKVGKYAASSISNVEERGLILDQGARVQALPDMVVACKDVALASHSAATAPIDKEALFYLNSRGIDDEKSRRMFIASFLSKYLENVGNDIVKEISISILLDKLDNGTNSQVPKISAKSLWVVPKKK
jgi:hypothetical protein